MVILTSNKPFKEWGELIADDAVATAISHRLRHLAHQCDLYRMTNHMKIRIVDFSYFFKDLYRK